MKEFNTKEYRLYLSSLSFENLIILYGCKCFYGDTNLEEKLRLIFEEIERRRV